MGAWCVIFSVPLPPCSHCEVSLISVSVVRFVKKYDAFYFYSKNAYTLFFKFASRKSSDSSLEVWSGSSDLKQHIVQQNRLSFPNHLHVIPVTLESVMLAYRNYRRVSNGVKCWRWGWNVWFPLPITNVSQNEP